MKEVIFAGFGGQGVLTAGLILANAAMNQGVMVSWMPSYGPAMRGGTANACVKYGETAAEPTGAPTMRAADMAMVMNEPSLSFISKCKKDAVILLNSNTISKDTELPEGYRYYWINSDKLAYEANNAKGTSIVMLGAMVRICGIYTVQDVEDAMNKMFAEKGKNKYEAANVAAFRAGVRAAEELLDGKE